MCSRKQEVTNSLGLALDKGHLKLQKEAYSGVSKWQLLLASSSAIKRRVFEEDSHRSEWQHWAILQSHMRKVSRHWGENNDNKSTSSLDHLLLYSDHLKNRIGDDAKSWLSLGRNISWRREICHEVFFSVFRIVYCGIVPYKWLPQVKLVGDWTVSGSQS